MPTAEYSSPRSCDEVLLTCPNPWCVRKEQMRPSDFAEHRRVCAGQQPASCIRCGVQLTRDSVRGHEAGCHAMPCQTCGEVVIGRLLPFCPNRLRKPRVPRITGAVRSRERSVRVLQSAWRRWRVRNTIYKLAFAIMWREVDGWDERTGRATRSLHPPQQQAVMAARSREKGEGYPDGGLSAASTATRDHAVRRARECLTNQSGAKLSRAFAERLLEEAEAHLKRQPNVQRAMLASDPLSRVIVVGDLHGQGPDLDHLLALNGLPSATSKYIFNGDLVDRGTEGCEVLFMVLVLLLCFPGCVWINRGNHEALDMNAHYGFVDEVEQKYGGGLYQKMLQVFCSLPLCTIIEEQIMVVHAGLPRDSTVTLEYIDTIDRLRDVPVSSPHKGDQAFTDLLWSDPVDTPGHSWEPNRQRGVSVAFRSTVTEAFLAKNKLTTIIRSHEYPPAGYAVHHQGRIVTVFSASNYAGVDMNAAAVARVHRSSRPSADGVARGDLTMDFETWKHWVTPCEVPLAPGSPPGSPVGGGEGFSLVGGAKRGGNDGREAEVLRLLRERLADGAPQFISLFNTVDHTHTGSVWKTEWVQAMLSVLDVNLPWFFLRRYLVSEEPRSGRIQYATFLARYGVSLENSLWKRRWEPRALAWLLYRCKVKKVPGMRALFSQYELPGRSADGREVKSGLLGYDQFFRIVTAELGTTVTSRTVLLLYRTFDPASTGFVTADLCALAERRGHGKGYVIQERKTDKSVSPTPVVDDTGFFMWDIWLLRRLRALLRRLRPVRAFQLLDADGDGELSTSDLRMAIARLHLPPGFCKLQTYRLGEGENRETVAELFGVSPAEVTLSPLPPEPGSRRALAASVQTWPLSVQQLENFRRCLDVDGDGVVGYNDFLCAFTVTDLTESEDLNARAATGSTFGTDGMLTPLDTPPARPSSLPMQELRLPDRRNRTHSCPPETTPPASPPLRSPPASSFPRAASHPPQKSGLSAEELRSHLASLVSPSASPRSKTGTTPPGSTPASPGSPPTPGGKAATPPPGPPYDGSQEGWTVHQQSDCFAGKNAHMMKADDVSLCRQECISRGFGGFAVWKGKAYFRAQPPGECLRNLKKSRTATFYIAPQQ
eukprot:TRINITY_DN6039_c0_g1_i1.p1 TRINITY_DN6039_c0_g1~~TRINITY_DN6039_c0_g1_i1.p1  ORF type:complete len:1292 (+),score=346.11 TRINITY_DN6039_c0_g1_i1:546-3878(+)